MGGFFGEMGGKRWELSIWSIQSIVFWGKMGKEGKSGSNWTDWSDLSDWADWVWKTAQNLKNAKNGTKISENGGEMVGN